MKLVTTKFKSGGLHEKHVVATWNVGNHLSICFWAQGNQGKPVSRWPVAGPSECWLPIPSNWPTVALILQTFRLISVCVVYVRKVGCFYEVQKTGTFRLSETTFAGHRDRGIKKPIKPGLTRESRDELDLALPCAFLERLYTVQISNLVCDSVLPGEMFFC